MPVTFLVGDRAAPRQASSAFLLAFSSCYPLASWEVRDRGQRQARTSCLGSQEERPWRNCGLDGGPAVLEAGGAQPSRWWGPCCARSHCEPEGCSSPFSHHAGVLSQCPRVGSREAGPAEMRRAVAVTHVEAASCPRIPSAAPGGNLGCTLCVKSFPGSQLTPLEVGEGSHTVRCSRWTDSSVRGASSGVMIIRVSRKA